MEDFCHFSGRKVKASVILILAGFLVCLGNSYSATASCSLKGEGDIVKSQLGYLPTNFISISARKCNGEEPVAIMTYPLNGGAKRRQSKAQLPGQSFTSPFPTLYWLTCPEICKAIADLERRGFMQQFEATLKAKPEMARRLIQCHEEYAHDRWRSLTAEDQALLSQDDSSIYRIRAMMKESGISGTNFTVHGDCKGKKIGSIKCLHAHYAHFRSTMELDRTSNPVGEMTHSALQKQFPNLVL
eukprot:scaffold358_cov109-Cylindrotheca_fusiformis.AAC.3